VNGSSTTPSANEPLTPGAAAKDAAFAATALPLLPHVRKLARILTGNQADADDVVQETFLRAYRYWHTFDPGTDCRRWLATICRRVLYDQHRRDRQVEAVDDAELESLAAARTHKAALDAGLGDMYSRLDLGPAIMQAMTRLDPVFREVVVFSDVEGYTYEEIARQLEIPIGTVRSRLYRARRMLQEALMVYALDAGYGVSGARK
jgi:RNA polymerase sigma-70 factor (ECF subfamily)